MSLKRNFTDVEFVVRGNSLPLGSLTVQKNKGPADKSVQDNSGGGTLDCVGNADPFAAAGNTFPTVTGQCVEV